LQECPPFGTIALQMKKLVAVVTGILIAATVGVYFYPSFCQPVSASCDHPAPVTDANGVQEIAPRYYKYSEAALARARSEDKKVILYFWAPWCSSCASLDIEIEKNPSLIPDHVAVLQIPYDTATELKHRYNIVVQHTFVAIDDQGNPTEMWVGGTPQDIVKMTE